MPTGFEIDDFHWKLINQFIGEKAREDGVISQGEMVDLMRQYWNLITDFQALKAEIRTRDDATEARDDIALRKALSDKGYDPDSLKKRR